MFLKSSVSLKQEIKCSRIIDFIRILYTVKYTISFNKDSVLDKWLNGIFTKICVYVNSEKELDELYNNIKSNSPQIPCVLIEDVGLTEFHNVKTKTCIGIGPWWNDEIDEYTKNLPLL